MPTPSRGSPSSPSSSPLPLLAAAVAAAAVAVLAYQLWAGDEDPARRTALVSPAPVAAPATAPPLTADRARRGGGLFGTPLADEEAPVPSRGTLPEAIDEDLPVAGEPANGGKRASRRRRRAERAEGEAGSRDPHAVFSSDIALPYATATRATLDDVPLNGEAGTISLWLQSQWGEQSQDDASFVVFGDGAVRLVKNVSFLRFEVVDGAGNLVGLGAPIAEWRPGEWHQVVAAWDGRVVWLYVDGALVSTGAQAGAIDLPPGTPVHIGSAFPEGRPVASGLLAAVTIRTRALTPTAVAKRFLNGPRPEG